MARWEPERLLQVMRTTAETKGCQSTGRCRRSPRGRTWVLVSYGGAALLRALGAQKVCCSTGEGRLSTQRWTYLAKQGTHTGGIGQ